MHELDLPRLAVYSTWGNTQEVGWVRYALDKFEVPFDLIYKERVKKGDLRASYDVILVPNQGRSGKGLVYDIAAQEQAHRLYKDRSIQEPREYTASPKTSPEGWALPASPSSRSSSTPAVCWSRLAARASSRRSSGLRGRLTPAGPRRSFTLRARSSKRRLFSLRIRFFTAIGKRLFRCDMQTVRCFKCPSVIASSQVLMRFPGGDKSVLSGLMRGANEIRNRPAIIDVPVGRGRVIAVCDEPLLSMAEPWRVQHAVQCLVELQRHEQWSVVSCQWPIKSG